MDNRTVEPKIIKISSCGICKGAVRVAGKSYLEKDRQAKNEFFLEVKKFDLNILEVTLEQYKANLPNWCSCPSKKHR